MEDVDYRTLSKLNQSLLKEILISPKAFLDAKARYESPKESTEEHFVFGSMVDIMLTGTKKEFDEKFYRIPDDIKCTDSIRAIVTDVYDVVKDSVELKNMSEYKQEILLSCKQFDYQPNWKDDTRVEKIIALGSGYFNILAASGNKIKVTEKEYANAVACKMALQSDPYTRFYVDRKLDRNTEFLDKVIVEFDVDDLEIKGELDRVVINHSTKTIYPIDFKTTSKPVSSFESSFWFFRYDFQAATYMAGIIKHPTIEDLMTKGYKLDSFKFIVVEKDLRNNPMIFQVGNQALQIGYMGGELSNGKSLEGLLQAVARYQYAEENDHWQYPMEYYQNQGNIFIEP